MKAASQAKGFAKKPIELYILPWIFLVAPLLNLLGWWLLDAFKAQPQGLMGLISLNYGSFSRGQWDTVRAFALFLPYAVGIVAAIGLWVVRPWGFWLCATYGILCWFTSSWKYVLSTSSNEVLAPLYSPFMPSALFNLVFFIPVLILLRKDLVAPFFQPGLRWWEQHKRFKLALPLEIKVKGSVMKALTFDISLHGCFIADAKDLPMNEELGAKLDLGDGKPALELKVKAAWKTAGSKHYPAGIGCKFQHLEEGTKQRLGSFLRMKSKEGLKKLVRD